MSTFRKDKSEGPTIIIDGMNLFFRAMYRFKSLSNSEGNPTGAVYGFTEALLNLAREFSTNRFVVIWEGQNNWKKKRSEKYKAGREKRKFDEETIAHLKYGMWALTSFLDSMGVVQIKKEGHEADDVVAHLARNIFRSNTIIYSSDKDFAQMVDSSAGIFQCSSSFNKGKETYALMREDDVKEKYGVFPKHIDKLLAIAGDAGDGVPGVRGFGPKKAVALINGGMITRKRIESVFNDEQLKDFFVSWSLVRLGRMPMRIGPSDVFSSAYNERRVMDWLIALEFNKHQPEDYKKVYNASMLAFVTL